VGCLSVNLMKKAKPIGPVNPVDKPLRPLGMHSGLGRQGITRGSVPHNPRNRPPKPELVPFLTRD
jgi:hypothetical protein